MHLRQRCQTFFDKNLNFFNELPKNMKVSVKCSSEHSADSFYIPVEKLPQQSKNNFAQSPELAVNIFFL